MDYSSVSLANIDRVESLLELLSDVYDDVIKRYQDIQAEPRYSYDEKKRKAKRQELYKLQLMEAKCLAQYHYWNDELKRMKYQEQSERDDNEN